MFRGLIAFAVLAHASLATVTHYESPYTNGWTKSALPVSDDHQRRIAEALEKRLGRRVELSVSTDASLIGGAVIRAGDLVIDGSVRAQLEKLAAAVSG